MAQLNENIDLNYDDDDDLEEESSLENCEAFIEKNKQIEKANLILNSNNIDKKNLENSNSELNANKKIVSNDQIKKNYSNITLMKNTNSNNHANQQSKFLSKNGSSSDLNFSKNNKSEKSITNNNLNLNTGLNNINNISEIKAKQSPNIHNNSNSFHQLLEKNIITNNNLTTKEKDKIKFENKSIEEYELNDEIEDELVEKINKTNTENKDDKKIKTEEIQNHYAAYEKNIIEEDEIIDEVEQVANKNYYDNKYNYEKNNIKVNNNNNKLELDTVETKLDTKTKSYNNTSEEEVVDQEIFSCNENTNKRLDTQNTNYSRKNEIMIENQEVQKTPKHIHDKGLEVNYQSNFKVILEKPNHDNNDNNTNKATKSPSNIISMFEKIDPQQIEEDAIIRKTKIKIAPGSSKMSKNKLETEELQKQPYDYDLIKKHEKNGKNTKVEANSRNKQQLTEESEEDYNHVRIVKSFEEGEYRQNMDQFDVEYMSRCLGLAILKHLENGQEKFHVVDILSDKNQKFEFFSSVYNKNFDYFQNFFEINKDRISNLQKLDIEGEVQNSNNASNSNQANNNNNLNFNDKFKKEIIGCDEDEDELNNLLKEKSQSNTATASQYKSSPKTNNFNNFNKIKDEFNKKEKQRIKNQSKEFPDLVSRERLEKNKSDSFNESINITNNSITSETKDKIKEKDFLPSLDKISSQKKSLCNNELNNNINSNNNNENSNINKSRIHITQLTEVSKIPKPLIRNANLKDKDTDISYFGHMKFNEKDIDTKFPPKIDLPKISSINNSNIVDMNLNSSSGKLSNIISKHSSDFLEFDKELKTINDFFNKAKNDKYKNLSETTRSILTQNLGIVQEIDSVQYCKDQLLKTVDNTNNKGELLFKSRTMNFKDGYNTINTNKEFEQNKENDYVDILRQSVCELFGLDKEAQEKLNDEKYTNDIPELNNDKFNQEDVIKEELEDDHCDSNQKIEEKTDQKEDKSVSNNNNNNDDDKIDNDDDIKDEYVFDDNIQDKINKNIDESDEKNDVNKNDIINNSNSIDNSLIKDLNLNSEVVQQTINNKFNTFNNPEKDDHSNKTKQTKGKTNSIDFDQISPKKEKDNCPNPSSSTVDNNDNITECNNDNNLPELEDNHFESGFVESNYVIDIQDAEKLRAFLLKNSEIYDDDFDYSTNKITHKRFVPPPDPNSIFEFCANVMIMTKMEKEVIIITLIYIERFIFNTGVLVNSRNWKRLVFTAMILASKIWDDDSFENNHFAQVFTHLTVGEINLLERTFLELINYKVYVKCSEYFKYFFIVKSIALKYNYDGLTLVPISLPKMMKLQEYAYQAQKKLRKRYALNNSTSN